jgi:hypothetical protein
MKGDTMSKFDAKLYKNIEGAERLVPVDINTGGNEDMRIYMTNDGTVDTYVNPMTGYISRLPEEYHFNLIEELKVGRPTTDLIELFGKAIGKEISQLDYCTADCEYPWNIEPNAVRCASCGARLQSYHSVESLANRSINLQKRQWAPMTALLKAALEGKALILKKSSVNGTCWDILIAWANENMFRSSGKTTFRGTVNRKVIGEYIPEGTYESKPSKMQWVANGRVEYFCGMALSQASLGFARFVDDFGAQLVEDPLRSVKPELEEAARQEYIHNAFINGSYYTQTGETSTPEVAFIRNLYTDLNFRTTEIAKESAWEIYVEAVNLSGRKPVVHKNGTISWRFLSAIEAIDLEALQGKLISRFGATPEDVAFLTEEELSE